MRLGIFAKTFSRPTVEGVFDAVREHGLNCVQFNMACAGLPSLPDHIAPSRDCSLFGKVRESFPLSADFVVIKGEHSPLQVSFALQSECSSPL